MQYRIIRWLKDVPISDPVDLRNAPLMQVLLILIGCFVPINKAAYLYVVGARLAGLALFMDLATDVITTLAAWLSLYLVRRGLFRSGIALLLGVMVTSFSATVIATGAYATPPDAFSVLMLVIAGLVLGQRALWQTFGVLVFGFVASIVTDSLYPPNAKSFLTFDICKAISLSLTHLIVAAVTDRTVTALQESLDELRSKGLRLQREMAEREQAQEQLIHAQKMEAVGRLASGVAHDFSNILGVIIGFASERGRLDEPDRIPRNDILAMADALEGIDVAARRGATISRKLLRFSRNDTTQLECFDVSSALQEMTSMLHQLFGAQIRARISLANDEPLMIRFDRSQFELMILNLASNARDAMPEGGEFVITAQRSMGTGRSVIITLTDNGIGMEADVKNRIFEPFFTTKPVGLGTGIGLAVAHSLVVENGGDIGVKSEPGSGSVFRIELPMNLKTLTV